MPNERFKSENYQNFGGINKKASAYLTGPREFLDIRNFDLSVPGALTMRPGSTQYFSTTFASGANYLYEFEKTNGASEIIVTNPGGTWSGKGNTVTGLSLGNLATGQSATPFFGFIGYYSINTATYFNAGAFLPDSVVYNDFYYQADGKSFTKYNGTSLYFTGLPYAHVLTYTLGYTSGAGFSVLNANSTERLIYMAAFKNIKGTIGPTAYNQAALGFYIFTTSGLTYNFAEISATYIPQGFGITSILLYRGRYNSASYSTPDAYLRDNTLDLMGEFAIGTTFVDVWNQGVATNTVFQGDIDNKYFNSVIGFSLTANSSQNLVTQDIDYPKYLEIYANRLFKSGYSLRPNDVLYSEIGDPELEYPENNFEVRTRDGDIITGLRSFYSALMVFKERSVHSLSGTGPDNFVLREVSEEYGLVNNRAVAIFKDFCWFLDRRGIVAYNGANIGIVSEKVEHIFEQMNLTAAKTEAVMLHNKERNEIWCSIPINGATQNNMTVVYDYDAEAWTLFDGYSPKHLAMIKGRNSKYNAFYPDYQGRVLETGSSYFSDNGATIAAYAQARYENVLGESTEKMFRRLFVNIDKLEGGQTTSLDITFRKNYATAIGLTRSLVTNGFQNVINFGISAKSLSTQVAFNSATERIRYYGYSLEYRYQRST